MNRFVLADPSKCIGCRTCEVACVLSHQEGTLVDFSPERFFPRISVVKSATITTPIMCRQCEDAPCAQVCPNGAISAEGGVVNVKQERCIGCKTCEVACPYGAMNVVTEMVDNDAKSDLFAAKVPRAFALKCDLCGGPDAEQACAKVCPTKAITLVTEQQLREQNKQKRQLAALAMAELNAAPTSPDLRV